MALLIKELCAGGTPGERCWWEQVRWQVREQVPEQVLDQEAQEQVLEQDQVLEQVPERDRLQRRISRAGAEIVRFGRLAARIHIEFRIQSVSKAKVL